ncbi:MAG: hypothetical protein J5829_06725 [Lachnospiraceae bacterium]|nr:hypothetical protein [Lachnospiraceae bacterium]
MRDENDIPAGGSGKVSRMTEPPASALVGLGLGVLSVILCWLPAAGIICGIIGITAASISLMKLRSGFGIGGLVTSIIGTVLSIIFAVVELFGFLQFMK